MILHQGIDNEVTSIKKGMAKLLKAFDELRNSIVISHKAKGDGLSTAG